MKYIIKGNPAKLASARHITKMMYDTHKHSRVYAEIDLQHQHDGRPIYNKSLHCDIYFYMAMGHHKKRDDTYHIIAPSLSKLIKFAEEMIKDIVIIDQFIISSLSAYKKYDAEPRTEIFIREIS